LFLNDSSQDLTLRAGDMLNIQAGAQFPLGGTIFLVVSLAGENGGLDPSTAVILASREMLAFEGLELDVKIPSLPSDIRIAVQAFVFSKANTIHWSSVLHVKIPEGRRECKRISDSGHLK
jgi:hypothetical protein